MNLFRICYITDRRGLGAESGTQLTALTARIAEAIGAGVDLIQIRENDLLAKDWIALVEPAFEAARGTPTSVVVNDRLDVALALGAAGVHLGQASLPAEVARRLAPPRFLVGVSCHALEETREAETAGADYVLLGPIFETPSKLAYGPPLGLEALRAAASRLKIPVLALGGITVERVHPCLDAGAHGIAGIRIFQNSSSLADRVRELRAQFEV